MPKAAVLQMTSGPEVPANLASAANLLEQAASAGAVLAVLPENFALMGRHEADKLAVAETHGRGPIQDRLAECASRLGLWIVAGTVPLRVDEDPAANGQRVAAASLVYDAQGKQVARYDKIHLFDVDLPGRVERYRESATMAPGDTPVAVDTPIGRLGLSVCYDVRFPELFRALQSQGAQVYTVPAAFTAPTGQAHWEILLRARAVENLAYVLAAAQSGMHANGRETHGDSLIVDPWGRVLGRRSAGPGVVVAEIDLTAQQELRERFPALTHRKLAT